MNRKLHNTLMAAVASASLMIAGLLAASPIVPPPVVAGATAAEAAAAIADLETETVPPLHSTRADADRTEPRARQRRQSLRMPFFSFASRS